jgi:hypothetical protein
LYFGCLLHGTRNFHAWALWSSPCWTPFSSIL